MKILSFNVSWECMSNSNTGSARNLGTICKKLSNNNYHCRDNLILYLRQIRNTYSNLDIICLQEASNLEILKSEFNSQYFFHIHQSGKEKMITILNLNLFNIIDIIPGEFKVGRPFCIFIIESKNDLTPIILVNMHYCSSFKTDNCNYISNELSRSLKQKYPNYMIDFSNYRIIVAGDFNFHLHPGLLIDNNNILEFKPFYDLFSTKAYKPLHSCCYLNDFNDKINHITDLILDSNSINQIIILKPQQPISDHLPIISILP